MYAQSSQTKKNSDMCTPLQCSIKAYANLLVVLIQQTFEHTFDYSHTQRAATLRIRLTRCNIVNAWSRNSHVHACEMCKQVFCLVQAKKLTVLYFRMTKFVIAENWMAVNNATDPGTAAKLDLNWEDNKTHLHDVTHGINRVDVICLATGGTKHLYPTYSGSIQFKSFSPLSATCPQALQFKPDTSLVDVM